MPYFQRDFPVLAMKTAVLRPRNAAKVPCFGVCMVDMGQVGAVGLSYASTTARVLIIARSWR